LTKLLLLLILIFNFSFALEKNPLYLSSKTLPKFNQENFLKYVNENKEWLESNRIFLTKNQELELFLNSPYERKPINQKASKGILLVHGLSDSPAYFHNLTQELVSQGFLVRTILLTGHGSKPADLINVEFKQWENLVKHHIKLLEKEVENLWLGGFSTGANLVTSYALQNEEDISGLLLFSPGFASNQSTLLPFSKIGSFFKTWLFQNDNSKNILRYESLSMNASNLYYQSLKKVEEGFDNKNFSKPVFITISEDDSVIESKEIVSIFTSKFKNSKSHLLWFGRENNFKDKRIIHLPSYLPNQNIANFSHLSVLFKKNHFFYGINNEFKMFRNGQDKIYNSSKDELWYSAWGLKEEGKYFARLTWNPYFEKTIEHMTEVINSNKINN
tara:strand:+ start:7104 stop:8267 length:1164 start_codon:yes stop_codon:yes gene_type:complete